MSRDPQMLPSCRSKNPFSSNWKYMQTSYIMLSRQKTSLYFNPTNLSFKFRYFLDTLYMYVGIIKYPVYVCTM